MRFHGAKILAQRTSLWIWAMDDLREFGRNMADRRKPHSSHPLRRGEGWVLPCSLQTRPSAVSTLQALNKIVNRLGIGYIILTDGHQKIWFPKIGTRDVWNCRPRIMFILAIWHVVYLLSEKKSTAKQLFYSWKLRMILTRYILTFNERYSISWPRINE